MVINLRVFRGLGQQGLEGRDGVGQAVHFQLGPAEKEAHLGVLGQDGGAALQDFQSLGVLAVLEIDPAQVPQDVRVKRPARQGRAQLGDRLAAVAAAGQGQAVAVVGDGVPRLGGQGRFKSFQGGLLVAVNGDQARLGAAKGVGIHPWEGGGGFLVRHPSVDIGDAVFGGRVGHEVVGDLAIVVPLLGAHFLEDVDDALAAVAGLVEVLEADLVGLDFVLAAVGQHGRLAGRHGADGQGTGRRTGAADAQKNARGDPRQGGQLDLLAAFDLL